MEQGEREALLVEVFQWIRKQGGYLPASIYWERLKTFPTVHHECVEFCPSADGTGWEVLLDLRPPDDPHFPSMYGTQGFTVMTGDVLQGLFERHCAEESYIPTIAGDFRFCGLGVSPHTKRDHAYVVVFARLLPGRPATIQDGEYRRDWVPVSRLGEVAMVPSNRFYLQMAINVMLNGAMPYYGEFHGKV
ncbi:MAG: hypothetical protein CEO12_218 [Parcubacteria group bacterium Gr01-1014_46]|nr:MAG: hypothetical protein CEO12_218 [Parcubacteria group bacterium Gr01-1014_46]